MQITRWAILGLGRIAHKFAQDLMTLPNADLVAVASTDQARADERRAGGTLRKAVRDGYWRGQSDA